MKKNKKKQKKSIKLFLIILTITLIKYIYSLPFNNEYIYSNLSTIEKLKQLSKEDNRINQIINNYNDYPEPLLDMLSRDLDMLDFVIDYPKKLGNVYADKVDNIEKEEIPLLLQWDKRWGYAKYGNSSIAISGCGPTALSMVIIGLTKDNTITPYKIAKFSEKNGYYSDEYGTSWSLMTQGARHFGVKSKEISLSKEEIFKSLQNGNPIICSMKKGDFTTTGHFIVLTSIKNNKIKINDPNSKKRSNELWDYDTLQYQIRNLWEYSL